MYGYLNALHLSLFDVQAYLAVAAGEISIAPESRGRWKKRYSFPFVERYSIGSFV